MFYKQNILPPWPFQIEDLFLFYTDHVEYCLTWYITYTSRPRAAPRAVGLAHTCKRAHQHIGGAAAVRHLRLEDETLAFSFGLSRDAWIAAELGCKIMKKSGFWLVWKCYGFKIATPCIAKPKKSSCYLPKKKVHKFPVSRRLFKSLGRLCFVTISTLTATGKFHRNEEFTFFVTQ